MRFVWFVWDNRVAKVNLAVLVAFDEVFVQQLKRVWVLYFYEVHFAFGVLFPTRFEFRAFSRRDSR